jgi:aryl-alcohol dehydrogenase-like predicted oxidoreductase
VIPKIPFGRTGHQSSRAIFGAAGLSTVTQDQADRALEQLLTYGVNHIDTAASYGESELRIGPWMPAQRQNFFLASKTGDRTYQAAKDSIHRSLERLRTDHLDSIQLHNLVDPNEWETAMGPGGALEAVIEARAEGLVRFIGVTGHGLTVAAQHKRALEQFDFDSVLLPYSHVLMQNEQYTRDFEALMRLCEERKVAVQTIKTITRRPWGERPQTTATWYEPLEDQADIDKAVHWALARPDVFICTAGDVNIMPKVLESANHPGERPDEAVMQALLEQREMAPLFTA